MLVEQDFDFAHDCSSFDQEGRQVLQGTVPQLKALYLNYTEPAHL